MHDPLTVAFDINYPWKQKPSQFWPKGYRSTFITIWHKDPCSDGSDDSCDWWGHKKKKLAPKVEKLGEAIWHLESILDNRPFFPDHEAHLRFQPVKKAFRALRVRSPWRVPVRWHVWHWRIQVHPFQAFMRWVFARCSKCGGRFKYGESACSGWGGGAIWHTWHEGSAQPSPAQPTEPGVKE